MKWIEEKISSFTEVTTGGTPSTDKREFWNGGTIPWLNSGDLNQGIVTKASNFITEQGYKSSSTKLMPPNTVLIALTGATTGLTALLKIEACANQSVTGILPSEKHYPEFLYYFFKTQRQRILDAAWGGAQPHINQRYIKDYVVPLPPLRDQIKIAKVLSKAEALIYQRKENIDLLDELLKSTFLKMFQQYFQKANSHKLATLCTKITDGTHDTPERLKQGVKFITGKHIRPYVIDFDNSDYVTEEVHKEIYRRCNPEFGDILYTNIGVNLGTAAMNNVDYEFSMKNVALLKLNQSLITSRYLEHFLNLPTRRNRILELNSSGGAQQFLSLGQIKNIDVPVPPIELQRTFSEIVEKSELLKKQLKKNLNDLDNLFSSLSQRAFKGKLDLSNLNLSELGVETIEIDVRTRTFLPSIDAEKFESKGIERIPIAEDERYGDPFEVDEDTAKKQGSFFYKQWKKLHTPKRKSKTTWDRVSTEQAANWIKENFTGYHFTCEMLIRFLTDVHVTFPDYYSSEELKKFPKYNSMDDLHTLIFSAVNGENPYLKLKQIFYNGTEKTFSLNLSDDDIEMTNGRSDEQMTGIYFTIE